MAQLVVLLLLGKLGSCFGHMAKARGAKMGKEEIIEGKRGIMF